MVYSSTHLLLVRAGDVGQVPGKLDWRGEHDHVIGVGDLPHLRHRAAGDHGPLEALDQDQVLLTDDIHLAHGTVPILAERRLAPLVGDVEGAHPSQALRQRVVLRRAQLVQLLPQEFRPEEHRRWNVLLIHHGVHPVQRRRKLRKQGIDHVSRCSANI
jgi:hypothetical protein